MAKLLCDSTAVMEGLMPLPAPSPEQIGWPPPSPDPEAAGWEEVRGLEKQQRRHLQRIYANGVLSRDPNGAAAGFRLSHGGEVDADGNCLFTAVGRAAGIGTGTSEIRRMAVARFVEDYGAAADAAIRHLYSPDLSAEWGIHVVQEVKLLARKADHEALRAAVLELVDLGLPWDVTAESIYKERCMAVIDGSSWAKYMSISGSPEDEHDIVTLQYTEEGLLSIDENRDGRSAAFGDDIAIECLATEFGREIFVVQAHGLDAMVDEENCVFFLPHRSRGQICDVPIFLFIKGTSNSNFTCIFHFWKKRVHYSDFLQAGVELEQTIMSL